MSNLQQPPSVANLLLGVWGGFVVVFLILPILVVLPIGFSAGTSLGYPLPGLSLRWFAVVLSNYPWMFALKNSLIVAFATVALAVPLGTCAAYGLATYALPGRSIVLALLMSPLLIPVAVTAVATFFFLDAIGLLGTYAGLILADTVLALPLVVLPVSATLQGYDKALTLAATSLGASPLTSFLQVTLPLILPGVVSGAIFAFITSFDEVVVALFVSSPDTLTLPRQLFSGLRDQLTPALVAVACLIIIISLVLLGLLELIRRRGMRLKQGSR